jgi:ubiquinone biosynthesis protein UbiJ
VFNLPVPLSAAIELAFNRYLALDPDATQRLQALAGKVIGIELRDVNVRFYFLPAQDRMHVHGRFDSEPDTVLRGTSLGMTRMSLSENASDSLFSGDVQISGDVELGEQFRAVLDSINIDWEEQLSKLTGDVLAHQAGNLVRGAVQWGKKASDTLQQDLSEYLHEESRVLPVRHEVDDFINAVDEVRMAVDRLQARVQRLQQQLDLPSDNTSSNNTSPNNTSPNNTGITG